MIAIIGGGIGGLTLALVLKKLKIPFKVFEASSDIKTVGAGILLANNAMQILKHLGLDDIIASKGSIVNRILITDDHFDTLSEVRLEVFEAKYAVQNYAIHRADLYNIIAGAVGYENIELNKRLVTVRTEQGGIHLTFSDGSVFKTQYLVGADGIKSMVRQQCFNYNVFRDAHQTCFRGVVKYKLPERYCNTAVEAWSKGKRFGFVNINEDAVYWYAVLNDNMLNNEMAKNDIVSGFDRLVKEMVDKTAESFIIKGTIYDLKPMKHWSKENVCLVGDAAHATTPNMGQGACQAIEDAYVLGELLKIYPVEKAFEQFTGLRKEKVNFIVNTSWKIGKIGHWKNPYLVKMRNFMMKKMISDKANLRQMDKLFQLTEVRPGK